MAASCVPAGDIEGGFVGFKVVLRCRPLNRREIDSNQKFIVNIDEQSNQVKVQDPQASEESVTAPKSFTFNKVFGPETSQQTFFSSSVTPVIDGIFRGTNGAVFAYGQTGTGKTWAVQGLPADPENCGFLTRSADAIFDHIRADSSRSYVVSLSYLEIYNENVRDLLTDTGANLRLKESESSGVYAEGLTHRVVTDARQCLETVAEGSKRRVVRQTMMSTASSRSHVLAIFKIDSKRHGEDMVQSSKLTLVDLAGSERQSKTGCTGHALKEGQSINLSLRALQMCISALTDKVSRHIPFRDSKLTRLLKDSLGGDSNTVMSCHVSPAEWNYDETLSTLRYGVRACLIKNKAKIRAPSPELNFPPPPPNAQLPATTWFWWLPASATTTTPPPPPPPPSLPPPPPPPPPLPLPSSFSSPPPFSPSSAQAQPEVDETTKPKEETNLGEEEWVVLLPQERDESNSVAAVARILEEEGVTSIAPAAFLARFQAFVGAK